MPLELTQAQIDGNLYSAGELHLKWRPPTQHTDKFFISLMRPEDQEAIHPMMLNTPSPFVSFEEAKEWMSQNHPKYEFMNPFAFMSESEIRRINNNNWQRKLGTIRLEPTEYQQQDVVVWSYVISDAKRIISCLYPHEIFEDRTFAHILEYEEPGDEYALENFMYKGKSPVRIDASEFMHEIESRIANNNTYKKACREV